MRLERRPVINLSLSSSDKTIEILSLSLLLFFWALALFNYNRLPEIIPTHFNLSGQADNYGNKSSIFELPIVGTIIFLLLTLCNLFPHLFNYMNKITTENATKEYIRATRMLRYLKLLMLVIFIVIVIPTI